MIAFINIISMTVSGMLCLLFYSWSVSPAALEKKIGEKAYKKCGIYRLVASFFMTVSFAGYFVYYFYPLDISLPWEFFWDWWVSIIIAIVIAIPATIVWIKGMKDAGRETMVPDKSHSMYQGIYNKIRHPQGLAEGAYWWVTGFALNSPFLVLYSFYWGMIFYFMLKAEEKDLVIRFGEPYTEYQKRTGFVFGIRSVGIGFAQSATNFSGRVLTHCAQK